MYISPNSKFDISLNVLSVPILKLSFDETEPYILAFDILFPFI